MLHIVEDFLEGINLGLGLRFQPQNHIAVHGHKPPVGVPSEPLVLGLFNQPLHGAVVKTNIENSIHHTWHARPRAGTAGN
ncbi:hypothetical protein HRbin36_02422 [bacterium HR36]|nr:hypothetical protein HRbin36_02422 [bacterium HR36]